MSTSTQPFNVYVEQVRTYVITIDATSKVDAMDKADELFVTDNRRFRLANLETEVWDAEPVSG